MTHILAFESASQKTQYRHNSFTVTIHMVETKSAGKIRYKHPSYTFVINNNIRVVSRTVSTPATAKTPSMGVARSGYLSSV
ncbi:uncharacterized protein VTP21DRAFT_10498 [Calcarisporiella thermophila]|uniref:uncharacterized protein n=1 Tax=Calcarisporiella thermophila TaxID=911321 RepID=UPI003742B2C2